MEQGKSYKNGKGKAQAGKTPVRPNTDVLYDVGLSHSSDEIPVMGMERRGWVSSKRAMANQSIGRSPFSLRRLEVERLRENG